MTVRELRKLLAALPDQWQDCDVMQWDHALFIDVEKVTVERDSAGAGSDWCVTLGAGGWFSDPLLVLTAADIV